MTSLDSASISARYSLSVTGTLGGAELIEELEEHGQALDSGSEILTAARWPDLFRGYFVRRGCIDGVQEICSSGHVARIGVFDRRFDRPVAELGARKQDAIMEVFQLRGFIGARVDGERRVRFADASSPSPSAIRLPPVASVSPKSGASEACAS